MGKIYIISGGPIINAIRLESFVDAPKILEMKFSKHYTDGRPAKYFNAYYELMAGRYYYASDHPGNLFCNEILKESK